MLEKCLHDNRSDQAGLKSNHVSSSSTTGNNSTLHIDNLQAMTFIPDELILEILAYLDIHSLRNFGYTSKASFAFHLHEDLWKQLFLLQKHSSVNWRGTWRRTVLKLSFEKE